MIYTIGESIFDIIFNDQEIVAGKPGGSVLNSSVSLGRMGYPVSLISELGNDDLGRYMLRFLQSSGVKTDYIYLSDEMKTTLAIAFLNEWKNASYTFYRFFQAGRFQGPFPEIKKGDIVLFGSIAALSPETSPGIRQFVRQAYLQGAITLYDPNIRPSHRDQFSLFRDIIRENLSMSDIIRASTDDFRYLFDFSSPEDIIDFTRKYTHAVLILTDASQPVHLFADHFHQTYNVPAIQPVSTIGAGDTFNASIAASMFDLNIERSQIHNISQGQWKVIIERAITVSQKVCMSYDNYL